MFPQTQRVLQALDALQTTIQIPSCRFRILFNVRPGMMDMTGELDPEEVQDVTIVFVTNKGVDEDGDTTEQEHSLGIDKLKVGHC
jgi:hypothetical protein